MFTVSNGCTDPGRGCSLQTSRAKWSSEVIMENIPKVWNVAAEASFCSSVDHPLVLLIILWCCWSSSGAVDYPLVLLPRLETSCQVWQNLVWTADAHDSKNADLVTSLVHNSRTDSVCAAHSVLAFIWVIVNLNLWFCSLCQRTAATEVVWAGLWPDALRVLLRGCRSVFVFRWEAAWVGTA